MAPQIGRERYRLKSPTIAVATADGSGHVSHVPAGSEILLLNRLDESGTPNRMVEIEWQNRRLKVFAVDVQERGESLSGA